MESLLQSCRVAQKQGASRTSLATATYLSDLVPQYQECGIDAEGAVQEVVADILWAKGEQGTSIRMLQQLTIRSQTSPNKTSLHESTILAKLVSSPSLGCRRF
jgi:serine-protein kinase ATM